MNNILKTSLGCLFIALALNTAFTYAQQSMWLLPYPPIPLTQPRVSLAQPQIPIQPDMPWLQINSHSKPNERQKPEWTVIITSIKPSIKQIDTNRWEISFMPWQNAKQHRILTQHENKTQPMAREERMDSGPRRGWWIHQGWMRRRNHSVQNTERICGRVSQAGAKKTQ